MILNMGGKFSENKLKIEWGDVICIIIVGVKRKMS